MVGGLLLGVYSQASALQKAMIKFFCTTYVVSLIYPKTVKMSIVYKKILKKFVLVLFFMHNVNRMLWNIKSALTSIQLIPSDIPCNHRTGFACIRNKPAANHPI